MIGKVSVPVKLMMPLPRLVRVEAEIIEIRAPPLTVMVPVLSHGALFIVIVPSPTLVVPAVNNDPGPARVPPSRVKVLLTVN